MAVDYSTLRITKLREYLFSVIEEIKTGNKQINAYMLDNEVGNYSLDKIPTDVNFERWIDGTEVHKDIYSFRGRFAYSQDTIENLSNIGFFEIFEATIKYNNRQGILPNITGIKSIECLNCGTMIAQDDMSKAIFDIQIQITYKI